MGDQGNAKLKQSNGADIWLYTHWHGYDIPQLLAAGLKLSKPRWGDDSYFNRCMITEFTRPASDDTGFGVSMSCGDNSDGYPIVEIDRSKRRVSFLDPHNKIAKTTDFYEFMANPCWPGETQTTQED